jgi:hypothetical protein
MIAPSIRGEDQIVVSSGGPIAALREAAATSRLLATRAHDRPTRPRPRHTVTAAQVLVKSNRRSAICAPGDGTRQSSEQAGRPGSSASRTRKCRLRPPRIQSANPSTHQIRIVTTTYVVARIAADQCHQMLAVPGMQPTKKNSRTHHNSTSVPS